MQHRVVASLVLATSLAIAGPAGASSIGLFFAPDGSDCDGSVPPFAAPVRIYALAILGGDPAAAGMIEAEFRIEGHQGFSFVNWVLNPSLIGIPMGDPTQGGCRVAYSACQADSPVLLGWIELAHFTGPAPQDVTLRIEQATVPSDANFQCPSLTLCDAPVFTKLCVPGGQAFVNSPRACTVGVEQASWSTVRSLYRN